MERHGIKSGDEELILIKSDDTFYMIAKKPDNLDVTCIDNTYYEFFLGLIKDKDTGVFPEEIIKMVTGTKESSDKLQKLFSQAILMSDDDIDLTIKDIDFKLLSRTRLGCRKPDTLPGTWTGAFVAYKGLISAMFDNGQDYISSATWKQCLETYEKLTSDGWIPMTDEDMAQTSGVSIPVKN